MREHSGRFEKTAASVLVMTSHHSLSHIVSADHVWKTNPSVQLTAAFQGGAGRMCNPLSATKLAWGFLAAILTGVPLQSWEIMSQNFAKNHFHCSVCISLVRGVCKAMWAPQCWLWHQLACTKASEAISSHPVAGSIVIAQCSLRSVSPLQEITQRPVQSVHQFLMSGTCMTDCLCCHFLCWLSTCVPC